MIICVCHRVSDRDIARAVREGCADFETLQDELRVATGCGACHDCACGVFHAALSQAAATQCHSHHAAPPWQPQAGAGRHGAAQGAAMTSAGPAA